MVNNGKLGRDNKECLQGFGGKSWKSTHLEDERRSEESAYIKTIIGLLLVLNMRVLIPDC